MSWLAAERRTCSLSGGVCVCVEMCVQRFDGEKEGTEGGRGGSGCVGYPDICMNGTGCVRIARAPAAAAAALAPSEKKS